MLLSGIRYQFHSMSLKLGKMSEMQNYALCLLFSGLSTADLCSFVVSSKPPHAMGLKLKAVITEPAQSETRVKYQSNRAINICPQAKIFQGTSSDCFTNENERSVCLGVRQRGL